MRLLVRLGLVILLLALAAAVYQLTPSYPDLGGEEDVKLYPIVKLLPDFLRICPASPLTEIDI
jgi:hypothetical protein